MALAAQGRDMSNGAGSASLLFQAASDHRIPQVVRDKQGSLSPNQGSTQYNLKWNPMCQSNAQTPLDLQQLGAMPTAPGSLFHPLLEEQPKQSTCFLALIFSWLSSYSCPAISYSFSPLLFTSSNTIPQHFLLFIFLFNLSSDSPTLTAVPPMSLPFLFLDRNIKTTRS